MSWVDPDQNAVMAMDTAECRKIGLAAANTQHWGLALLRLNEAARGGHLDLELLDALGEAAYRKNVPEALSPYQNHYKYPTIATHMARAFMMLGDLKSAREFLEYAKDSPLKAALYGMLEMGAEISHTAKSVLPVAEKYPDLYYPEYWRALAAVADAVGREDLTKLAERRSKAYAYKDPNIHFNQALRMLGKGEFRAGWRLYDWRLVPGAKNANRTQLGRMSMWEGQKLAGRSLLVFAEQGLGDVIFGMRYIKPLLAEGARIEIVGRKPVIPMIKETYPDLKVHDEDDVAVCDYWDHVEGTEFWTYALSVPNRAGLWHPTNTGAFLKVPQSYVDEAQAIIDGVNLRQLPVYTINWHGRIDTDSDRTRAFSVVEFANISGILAKPCLVVSVQKDATADEIAQLDELVTAHGGQVLNAAPYLETFGQTAGFIKASERLLTCDTSVAHVGGSIGHPTLVLARNKAIWQWLRKENEALPLGPGGEDQGAPSLWYDSVTVKYALAPEISWLFTTFENKLEKDKDKNKDDEHINGGNREHPDCSKVRPSEFQPVRFQRSFNFAGRNRPDPAGKVLE